MIRKKYKLHYPFGEYNKKVSAYINSLISSSINKFEQQVSSGQMDGTNKEEKALVEAVANTEQYLYYIYKKYPKKFEEVFGVLSNDLKTIALLNRNSRGIYGYADTNGKTLYVRPFFDKSGSLRGKERAKLYTVHEIGHFINKRWMAKVERILNDKVRSGNIKLDYGQLICDGFTLLDEAIAQNRAENFVYEIGNKKRPKVKKYSDGYSSNFDYYEEFQEPATLFARTLDGFGEELDDSTVLNMLSEKAFSSDFFNFIERQHNIPAKSSAFIKTMESMGLIKRAAYAKFGRADRIYLQKSKEYLDQFRKNVKELKKNSRNLENLRKSENLGKTVNTRKPGNSKKGEIKRIQVDGRISFEMDDMEF